MEKSILSFLYTSNEQLEFEIKNKAPFILTHPNMKYIDVNLTKYFKSYRGKLQNSNKRNQRSK